MKRIIAYSVIFALLLVIFNLSVSLWTLWSKKDLLTQTQQKLVEEQEEHVQLERQLQKVNQPGFIEEQARDKLFLSKPGETVILLPSATPSGSMQQKSLSGPTWQQWWELFF